jgi:hypothetical protein
MSESAGGIVQYLMVVTIVTAKKPKVVTELHMYVRIGVQVAVQPRVRLIADLASVGGDAREVHWRH